mmetsp:Transcript_30949/g.69896  ORF Transcript_30949/g.69896 Transcript_30949/m.69896 type:complete len:313 (+) Transcript_30949:1187-2125(+)
MPQGFKRHVGAIVSPDILLEIPLFSLQLGNLALERSVHAAKSLRLWVSRLGLCGRWRVQALVVGLEALLLRRLVIILVVRSFVLVAALVVRRRFIVATVWRWDVIALAIRRRLLSIGEALLSKHLLIRALIARRLGQLCIGRVGIHGARRLLRPGVQGRTLGPLPAVRSRVARHGIIAARATARVVPSRPSLLQGRRVHLLLGRTPPLRLVLLPLGVCRVLRWRRLFRRRVDLTARLRLCPLPLLLLSLLPLLLGRLLGHLLPVLLTQPLLHLLCSLLLFFHLGNLLPFGNQLLLHLLQLHLPCLFGHQRLL